MVPRFVWLTAIETAEPVGLPVERIVMIEQKSRSENNVVAIHMETGSELRVMESLQQVRKLLMPEGAQGSGQPERRVATFEGSPSWSAQ